MNSFTSYTASHRPLPWFSTINHQLGERVAVLRARWRIPSWEFAGSIGISNAHLDDIEHGREAVDLLLLHQIAGELHTSMSDLLHGM